MPLQINKIHREELSGTRMGELMSQINALHNIRSVITEIYNNVGPYTPKEWGISYPVPAECISAVRNVNAAKDEIDRVASVIGIGVGSPLSRKMTSFMEYIIYREGFDRVDLSRVIDQDLIKYIDLGKKHIDKLRDNLSSPPFRSTDDREGTRMPVAVPTGGTDTHRTLCFKRSIANDYNRHYDILTGIFSEVYDITNNNVSGDQPWFFTERVGEYTAQYCSVVDNINQAYSQFYTPKSGYKALRLITAPNVELKYVQRSINKSIQSMYTYSEGIMAYKAGADHVKQLKAFDKTYDSMVAVDFSNYFSEIKGQSLKTAMGELLLPGKNSELNAALKFFLGLTRHNTPNKQDLVRSVDPMINAINDAIYILRLEMEVTCGSYKKISRRSLPANLEFSEDEITYFQGIASDRRYYIRGVTSAALLSKMMQLDRIATEDWLIDNMHSILVIHQVSLLKILIIYKALLSELKKAGMYALDLRGGHSIARLVIACRYYTVTGKIFIHTPELRTHSGLRTCAPATVGRHMGNGIQVLNNALKRATGFDTSCKAFSDSASHTLFLKFAGLQLDALMSVVTHVIPVPEYQDRYIRDTIVSRSDLSGMFGKEVTNDGTILSTSKDLGQCPHYKTALCLSKNYGVRIRPQKALPQGAPTSGTIANLLNEVLLKDIDARIGSFAKTVIYSDNLFVFFNSGLTPDGRPVKYEIMDAVYGACRKHKIRINRNKTGFYEGCDRKLLGVLNSVNGDIRLSRQKLYELNQIIINLNKKPVINYKGRTYTRDGMSSYLGKLNWFNRVNEGTCYSRKKLIRPSW